MEKQRFLDKVVIITGAASGFGRVGAMRFAAEGAKVVIADVDEKNGLSAAEEICKAGYEAAFVKTDVSNEVDSENMVRFAVEKYGKLDVIWNNAGLQPYNDFDTAHESIRDFDRYSAVNIRGPWLGIHFAAPELVKTRGVIVNTASCVSYMGNYGAAIYCMTKGAIVSLTMSVAYEMGIYGVRCNCISPYTVPSPGLKAFFEQPGGDERKRALTHANALFKFPTMDDIVDAAMFLASDESSSITGHNLRVDCGSGVRTMDCVVLEDYVKLNPYENPAFMADI